MNNTVEIQSASSKVPSQRVLILEFDLYKNLGGGQSVYRRLIELNPQNTYYYFIKDESAANQRPINAKAIPFVDRQIPHTVDLPDEWHHYYHSYILAWRFADSIEIALGETEFDVVDTPDYMTTSLFLVEVFKQHGISVGVLALALHGTITSAFSDEWPHSSAPQSVLDGLHEVENLQYKCVDTRYAISEFYNKEWKRATGLSARPLDPLLIVGDLEPISKTGNGKPDILFVGRKERRKGPDIFVDICWSLTPGSYNSLNMIGSDSSGYNNVSSAAIIPPMINKRKIAVNIVDKMTRAQLDEHFEERTIVVLPSRYDQFNLIALEALRYGCPTFVSRNTGAAYWIKKYLPDLADLIIDLDCSRSAASAVQAAIDDYDGLRRRITDTITNSRVKSGDLSQLYAIYSPTSQSVVSAHQTLQNILVRFNNFNHPICFKDAGLLFHVNKWLTTSLSGKKTNYLLKVLRVVKYRVLALKVDKIKSFICCKSYKLVERAAVNWGGNINSQSAKQIIKSISIGETRRKILLQKEQTGKDVDKKLQFLSATISDIRLARSQVFFEMARLERKRGGDLVSATYCLRCMRWQDSDVYGALPFVTKTLKAHGFAAEAKVAQAMYGNPETARKECASLLREQYGRHLTKPDLPLELMDDRRGNLEPRVSVIVSLYNAESKLKTLLDNMRIQSLAKQGKVEIILVDSGSPTDEYKIFKSFAETNDLPILYARSADRETIQSAWNRGIKLARAPYLSFLGVDEGLHPDALSILADKLDAHPDVDWVIADSIVTEVDHNGVFVKDIMTYDRKGYDQNLVALETCYLSWVGGLYRRSIHDRFGYYDESFTAAGDTEFKSRILTHIKTLHVPQMLGVFNNYPEERTTQHPRAEIEDLRAWYLHRTTAGIAYSWDKHPVELAERLFRQALSYRKSYQWHISTDFDMAVNVARYLVERGESGAFADNALKSSEKLLGYLRDLDFVDFRMKNYKRSLHFYRYLVEAHKQEPKDILRLGLPQRPDYSLFNDNRYEQHWWSWSS